MAKLPRRSKLLPKGALIEFVRREAIYGFLPWILLPLPKR